MTFVPEFKGMLATAQLVVPLAVPLAPLVVFSQTTRDTPLPSAAVPARLMYDCVVVYDDPVVGEPIVTVGAVVSVVPPVLPPVLPPVVLPTLTYR